MKKFFKILIYTILFLIIAIIVGGYIFLKTFDLNKYKDQITSIASKALGRELKINGDASLGISLVPTIIIEDIELANAPWGSAQFMAKLKKAEVSFDILPLLQKQIVVNNVDLVQPQINLEVAKDGKANWQFENVDTDAVAEVREEAPAVTVPGQTEEVDGGSMALIAGIAAKNVAITNGKVVFEDGRVASVIDLVINKIAFSVPSSDDKIKASVDVVFNDNKIVANAVVGSINDFLNKKPFAVDLDAKAYGVTAKVSGMLENIVEALSFDMNVQVSNPSGNMGVPETSLDADVRGDLKKVAATIKNLEVAKNKITGAVEADISGSLPYVNASFLSDNIDLTKFSNPQKIVFKTPDLVQSAHASSMVPNDKVPYEFLGMANADVDLQIKSLVIEQGLTATNVVLNTKLKDRILTVNPLSLSFGSGNINIASEVNGNNKHVSLKMLSKGILLQELHKEFVVEGKDDFGVKEGGAIDIDVDVVTSGDTYRQLVQALNGQAIVIVDKTDFVKGGINFKRGKLWNLVVKTLQLDKVFKSEINMNCAVVRANLGSGKAKFPNGIAFDSKQINLSSNGTFNLVSDGLDFTLQPSISDANVTNIANALASLFKVTGTVENPAIAIDQKAAVKTAVGVALNAPVYVGGSLIMDSGAAPCYNALEGTVYQTRFPKPEGAAASIKDTYKETVSEVKQNLKDVEKSVRDVRDSTKQDLNDLKESGKQLLNSFKGLGKK